MNYTTASIVCSMMILSTGCVTQQTHDAALNELGNTRYALSSAQNTVRDQQQQIRENRETLERSEKELKELTARKNTLDKEYAKALDDLGTTRFQLGETQKRLEELQSRLAVSQNQIDTLRQIEAETKKRNEIYAGFVGKLQKMIDAGELTITIDKGRLVINLPENVLFASGSTVLSAQGETALKKIASVLKELPDRRFQVEGHTDNVPIHNAPFPSNWELSSGRALRVVHLMTLSGVAPQNVSAAGYGEFQPRADNATEKGKAFNRRIEIVMLPNMNILSSELPKLSDRK